MRDTSICDTKDCRNLELEMEVYVKIGTFEARLEQQQQKEQGQDGGEK